MNCKGKFANQSFITTYKTTKREVKSVTTYKTTKREVKSVRYFLKRMNRVSETLITNHTNLSSVFDLYEWFLLQCWYDHLTL